ncbi:alpha/beta-hydrolase [Mycena filopes]|nr:alpha/beta-hydrolase [Mycena filopes]
MSSPTSTTKILHSSDGTAIFAEATGDPANPHLVLLSGLSLSGCVFDDMCARPRLLESLYVVRYDIRGHGRSGKPTTAEAYASKLFAEDFRTVVDAFELKKPVLAGWCVCPPAVATDVVTHLPPDTLSGIVYLAGVPSTSLTGAMAAPPLLAALPGLLSDESVPAFQAASKVFIDRIFAHPESVPYAVRCLHAGHSLSPEVMRLSIGREMEVERLWEAGRTGKMPLLVVQGTEDGHREGGVKSVDEVMRPHFEPNYEMVWLEGRGHALHFECPDEIVDLLVRFTRRVGGQVSFGLWVWDER